MRSITGDENYDAILERVAELRAEHRLANPAPTQPHLPSMPAYFSVELGDVRMSIAFEHIGGRLQKTA